jgi:glycosyltransferase involved in cell wall biosynthesis
LFRIYIESCISSKTNQGPAGARNTGVRHSRADLLAFLDSDDLWLPTFLAEQIALFDADPLLDLAYARSFRFSGSIANTYPSRSPQSDQINFETIVTQKCQIFMSCTVVRKQAVIDAGLFDTRWRGVEDFDLWVRMAHRGCKMRRNDNLLGLYRLHETSVSHNQVKMDTLLIEQLRSLPSRLELSDIQKDLLLQAEAFVQCELAWLLGKEYLYAGNSAKALTYLKQAYKYFHSRKLQLTLLGLRFFPQPTVVAVKLHRWLRTEGR